MKQSLAGLWRFALGADHTTPPEAADTSSNNPNQWFQAQQAVAAEDYAYTQVGEDGLPLTWAEDIDLPATTETADKGPARLAQGNTLHLSRVRPFTGVAYYGREVDIPDAWAGQHVELYLERTKYTRVYVDGRLRSASSDTLVPQRHDLSQALTPGRHDLVVAVDNDLAAQPDFPKAWLGGSQYTDHSHTNWNGLLGALYLEARGPVRILDIQAWGETEGVVTATITVVNDGGPRPVELRLGGPELAGAARQVDLPAGESRLLLKTAPAGDPKPWSEFHPKVYALRAEVFEGGALLDAQETAVGLREVSTQGREMRVNGRRVSLRGRVDCAVFPRTGHAPMDRDSWRRVMAIARGYGLNHIRFHSWTPPEAAFAAADEAGVYLQVELPNFGNPYVTPSHPDYDPVLDAALHAQAEKVLTTYGNHPSFLLFSVGNEMTGEIAAYEALLRALKPLRPDILLTQGTNNFLADPQVSRQDDFWVIMRTSQTDNIRDSFSHADLPLGFLQTEGAATTDYDFNAAARRSPVPLIAHEVGQYEISPRLAEEDQYQGPVRSTALPVFRQRLKDAGLLHQADDFVQASGALSVLCYRAEIEALLRSGELTGFQLLDIMDFPGQATALVGVLDSFMESKGLLTPEAWRRFCAPQVLLARFPRYTYTAGEEVPVEVWVYSFGAGDLAGEGAVALEAGGKTLARAAFSGSFAAGSLTCAGSFRLPTAGLSQAGPVRLRLSLAGVENDYTLYVYPPAGLGLPQGVLLAQGYTPDVAQALQDGKTVVLATSAARPERSVAGFFASDFWCYPMFRGIAERKGVPPAPGTLGLLIDAGHPALSAFPTGAASDWQWQPIAYHGRPLVLDGLDVQPIVQAVDNFERNHKLGLLLEARVGPGRLLLCASDLTHHLDRPEVRALLQSLLAYAASPAFAPQTALSPDWLRDTLA